jgi:hypothetical protein
MAQHKRRGKRAKQERQIRAGERADKGLVKQAAPGLDIDSMPIIRALARREEALGRDLTDEEAIDFITDLIMLQIGAQTA